MTDRDLESLTSKARDKLSENCHMYSWREIAKIATAAMEVEKAIGAYYRLDSLINPPEKRR